MVDFQEKGWNDYLYWQTQDKRTLKKINEIIKDIMRNGYEGGRNMVTVGRYDVVDYLDSEEAIAGYLEAVMEEGGTKLFIRALPKAARARAILQLAKETGIDRLTLCKMLSDEYEMADSEYPALSPDAIARVAKAFAAPLSAT